MIYEEKHKLNAVLASKIKSGDTEAFNILYTAEYDNLVYFVSRYLKDVEQAKDLVQDSFFILWTKRSSIDYDKNIRSFLYTIARNSALNYLKSLRSRNTSKLSDSAVEVEIHALSHDAVSRKIEALSTSEAILKMCRELPNSARDSFVMSRFYQMTNKEIALHRNISEKAVEYHIRISLNILNRKLKYFMLLILGLFVR